MNLTLSVAGRTDIGLVRSGNEDALALDYDNNLFVVCDGMGGHKAGEVASREACDIIRFSFSEMAETLMNDTVLAIPASFPPRGALLAQSIRLANRSVYKMSRTHSDFSGMGTTVVAVAFDDDLICIAHVGDSRAYRLSPTELTPLTTDHSWITELQQSGHFSESEAAKMVNRNVITRALGINEKVEVDFRAMRVEPGAMFILCSDGLCGYASDEEIFGVAKPCGTDVRKIVDNLIRLANDRGGQDNVTVIAIRVEDVEGGNQSPEVSPVTIGSESDEALVRENEILGAIRQAEDTIQISGHQGGATSRKFPLALIFILFAIIAIVLVYITTFQK